MVVAHGQMEERQHARKKGEGMYLYAWVELWNFRQGRERANWLVPRGGCNMRHLDWAIEQRHEARSTTQSRKPINSVWRCG